MARNIAKKQEEESRHINKNSGRSNKMKNPLVVGKLKDILPSPENKEIDNILVVFKSILGGRV